MPIGVQLDAVTQAHVDKAIDDLCVEFAGVFSRETVDRFVSESIVSLADAHFADFVPVLAYRFARERLRALGQSEGTIEKTVPEVLFVCVQNAGRSQIAAALLKHHAAGRVNVRTAGSAPAGEIHPEVAQVLIAQGIDPGEEFPKPLTDEVVAAADVVVTMGAGTRARSIQGSGTRTGRSAIRPVPTRRRFARSRTRSTLGSCAC